MFLEDLWLREGSFSVCFLFFTEEAWSHGGLQARELGQTPLVLDMKSNVSTSPDLYIELSTEY